MCIKNLINALLLRKKKPQVEDKVFKITHQPPKTENIGEYNIPTSEIITARPEGMPFEKYKALRRLSNECIRRRLKYGFLVYKAGELFEETRTVKGKKIILKQYRTYQPFVGSTKKLKIK